MDKILEDAMWAGDEARLWEIAPCRCCCHEHTFGWGCPAYVWGGCRGQGSVEWSAEEESWARHYMSVHGMTRNQFYGG